MRQIEPLPLWLAHAGDLRSPQGLLDSGIRAIVDLAANEPIPPLPRDLVYCHVPLFDGAGNDQQLLRFAIRILVDVIAAGFPTAVACSNGLSRSPALAAAAISIVNGTQPDDELVRIAAHGKRDVSAGLWNEVRQALDSLRRGVVSIPSGAPFANGDRMTRAEFHRLYELAPEDVKAELIGGTVYMASPLRRTHGFVHLQLAGVYAAYAAATPGVEAGDNSSVLLADDSEPQPDLHVQAARSSPN